MGNSDFIMFTFAEPDKVMLSGSCPVTPPLGIVYTVNPNAFLTSPWYVLIPIIPRKYAEQCRK